jgi:hypothetical protein
VTETRDDLTVLRLDAEQRVRAHEWSGLLDLQDRLRAEDPEWWGPLWAITCAVATWHTRRELARQALDEALAAGFCQPELFTDELEGTFATEPGWSAALERMRANVPAPPVQLLTWPEADTSPLDLDVLPDERAALLRGRLPEPSRSATDTALSLLEWTTSRWEHANDHVEERDAVHVLDRVGGGERFACVEYSIVLSQSLNAVRIPARTLNLRSASYHSGFGRGHVVTEAWLDELRAWVVLDGQNGGYWCDEEGRLLGAVDLAARHRHGDRPIFTTLTRTLSEEQDDMWFSYFAHPSTRHTCWSEGPFAPTFQSTHVAGCERLVRGTTGMAPDLSTMATGITEGPSLRFAPTHPYADGVDADTELGMDEELSLRTTPGEHHVEVATRTAYDTLAPQHVSYLVDTDRR